MSSKTEIDRRSFLKASIVAGGAMVIGVSLPGDAYYIAKNDMRNIPDTLFQAYLFPTPAPYDPFQWYFAAE